MAMNDMETVDVKMIKSQVSYVKQTIEELEGNGCGLIKVKSILRLNLL